MFIVQQPLIFILNNKVNEELKLIENYSDTEVKKLFDWGNDNLFLHANIFKRAML